MGIILIGHINFFTYYIFTYIIMCKYQSNEVTAQRSDKINFRPAQTDMQ